MRKCLTFASLKHQRSISQKLLLYAVFLFLPVLIIGTVFLYWSKEQLKTQLESSAQLNIKHISDIYSSQLLDFSSQLNHLTYNKTFLDFYNNAENLTKSQYYRNLYEQRLLLKSYPAYYPIIEDVTVHYPNLGIALSTTDGLQSDSAMKQEVIIGASHSMHSFLNYHNEVFFLEAMYPSNSNNDKQTPMYLITMQLSKDYVVNLLDSVKDYHAFFYHNASNTIISSSSVDSPEKYRAYFDYINAYIAQLEYSTIFSWYDNDLYIIASYLPIQGCTFIYAIPMDTLFTLPNQLTAFLLTYTTFVLIAIFLFYILSTRIFKQSIDILLNGYNELESGNLNVLIQADCSTLEFAILIKAFNRMVAHLKESIDKVRSYELYLKQMEFKQLQLQMNPHFLYNTYFILQRLIQQEDIEQATKLASYLGSYFKYITRNVKNVVPLLQEWNHAMDYLQIQSIRFRRRTDFNISILPEAYHNFQVPPLILQPLLENAFEHGLKNINEGGIITLAIREMETTFEIIVSDNGNNLTNQEIIALDQAIHSGILPPNDLTALYNIYRRLQLNYSSKSDIKLTPNHPCGLCVVLTFYIQ